MIKHVCQPKGNPSRAPLNGAGSSRCQETLEKIVDILSSRRPLQGGLPRKSSLKAVPSFDFVTILFHLKM